MAFEVFDKKTATRTEEPRVTIQKRGNFSLNEAAARLLSGADDPGGLQVELLYDPENKVVGFRRSEKSPNPYILRKLANGHVYLIPGKAFTEHYGIDTNDARRYNVRELGGGIVGFALGDAHATVGRSKKTT